MWLRYSPEGVNCWAHALSTSVSRPQGETADLGREAVLRLEGAEQTFVFTEVEEKPVVSCLRDFSAPVKLEVVGQTEEDLIYLLGHDTDSFSKWEASQALQRSLLLDLYGAAKDEAKARISFSRRLFGGGVFDDEKWPVDGYLGIASVSTRYRNCWQSSRVSRRGGSAGDIHRGSGLCRGRRLRHAWRRLAECQSR